MQNLIEIASIILFNYVLIIYGYDIPEPILEILSPKGFRLSIPGDPKIVVFAFHGAINRPLHGIETGDFYGESQQPINNQFVYENLKEFLEPGDTLYYWIHVQRDKKIYRSIDQSILIPADTKGSISPITTTTTEIDKQDCVHSKTTIHGQHVCSGELIFEDSFDTLNWTKWQREIKMPLDSEDAEFVSFQDRPQNSYITDGKLYIVPTLLTDMNTYNDDSIRSGEIDFGSKCTGIVEVGVECHRKAGIFRILPPIVSAKLRTKDSFSFLYGRVEIRAKLPKGDWIFPQIFLEPLTSSYGIIGFASGQMRIAYIHGNEILETLDGKNLAGNQLYGGVVLSTGAKYRDIWLESRSWGNHLNRDFHVYSLTWTDQTITLAIDGNEYGILRGGFKQLYYTHNITHAQKWETGGFMAPFDKEFYLSLGVSVGGISDFPDRTRTGSRRKQKPWFNLDPKSELKFWKDRNNWYETWDDVDSGMIVDYIKVWAL